MDERGTQKNGTKDKEKADETQGFTPERWQWQTMLVQKDYCEDISIKELKEHTKKIEIPNTPARKKNDNILKNNKD